MQELEKLIFGRVGQQVTALLQELQQPLVGVSSSIRHVAANAIDYRQNKGCLKANVATAKSVVVVTDSEVANLEIGLMARAVNAACNLFLRTKDPIFAENVARLCSGARELLIVLLKLLVKGLP